MVKRIEGLYNPQFFYDYFCGRICIKRWYITNVELLHFGTNNDTIGILKIELKGIYMKIKWKIVCAAVLILSGFIIMTGFLFQILVTNLVTKETDQKLVDYSYLGEEIINATYPGEWSLVGEELYKGDILINNNFQIVDKFSGNTGIAATIFAMDTRVSTTVKDEEGNRAVGTKASDQVSETVLKNQQNYKGNANVAGKQADTYYIPLTDSEGNVVGMWFVGVYNDDIKAEIWSNLYQITGILLVVLIIGCFVSYLLGNGFSYAIIRLKTDFDKMAHGELNVLINEKVLKRKDEVGDITRSFNDMQKQLIKIMDNIHIEGKNIENAAAYLLDNSNNVYSDVENISATTQELSAGMEETAASTHEISNAALDIEKEIGLVAQKSENGMNLSIDIKQRANEVKESALKSQKTAVEIYDKANKQLRQSIEKSGAIEEIKSLSRTILAITAQTNLLALNASIESARAGEAGKGFAVVANEIRILAENSKAAVSKIEEITGEVAGAVEELVEDSKNLLKFVDDKVINDYKIMVETGDQYDRDAFTVEEVMVDVKNSADKLLESVRFIRHSIDEVALATNEGAIGSADIAEKSSSIAEKTSEVLEQAKANEESAIKLYELIKFFKY